MEVPRLISQRNTAKSPAREKYWRSPTWLALLAKDELIIAQACRGFEIHQRQAMRLIEGFHSLDTRHFKRKPAQPIMPVMGNGHPALAVISGKDIFPPLETEQHCVQPHAGPKPTHHECLAEWP